jgi:hypothetical protein
MPEDVADAAADLAVDLAVELVRIDSVNPALVPGAAGEGRIIEVLAGRLARMASQSRSSMRAPVRADRVCSPSRRERAADAR